MKTLLVAILMFVLLSGCSSQILDDQGLDSKSSIEVAEDFFYGSDWWKANVDRVRSFIAHVDIKLIMSS